MAIRHFHGFSGFGYRATRPDLLKQIDPAPSDEHALRPVDPDVTPHGRPGLAWILFMTALFDRHDRNISEGIAVGKKKKRPEQPDLFSLFSFS